MDMHTVFKVIDEMRLALAQKANKPVESAVRDLMSAAQMEIDPAKSNVFAFGGQVALDALKLRLEKLEEQYIQEMAKEYGHSER